jgi:hypothetical protein
MKASYEFKAFLAFMQRVGSGTAARLQNSAAAKIDENRQKPCQEKIFKNNNFFQN